MSAKIGLSPGPYPKRPQSPVSPWPARVVASMNAAGVHAFEIGRRRRLGTADLHVREPVEPAGLDQVPGEQHPFGAQRMLRARGRRCARPARRPGGRRRSRHGADRGDRPLDQRGDVVVGQDERRSEHQEVAVGAVDMPGRGVQEQTRRRARPRARAPSTCACRGNGSFVSRSATSSIPIIMPSPRTSPTDAHVGERRRRALPGASRRGPRRASTRSSSRRRSSVASATAAPSALCDHVNPCTNPFGAIASNSSPAARREPERHVAARRSLAGGDDVGADAPVVDAEPPSGASEPRHDLVGDHEHAVATADLDDLGPVVLARAPPRASVAPATGSAMNAATVSGP